MFLVRQHGELQDVTVCNKLRCIDFLKKILYTFLISAIDDVRVLII